MVTSSSPSPVTVLALDHCCDNVDASFVCYCEKYAGLGTLGATSTECLPNGGGNTLLGQTQQSTHRLQGKAPLEHTRLIKCHMHVHVDIRVLPK